MLEAAQAKEHGAGQISAALAAAKGVGGSSASAGSSAPRPAALARERRKIQTLCSLGFSPAVARHALKRCRGHVEDAGLFLLDAKNSDELYAVELQVAQESPLKPGCLARVAGLRGMRELNDTIVTLRRYDEVSQRWMVFMPDGAAKAIRAFNLDLFTDAQTAQPAQDAIHRKETVEGFTEEESRAKLVELAGESGADTVEASRALSGEDLFEAWACFTSSASERPKSVRSMLSHLASAPREPKGDEKPSNPSEVVTGAAASAPAAAQSGPDSEPAAAEAPEAEKSSSAPEPPAPHGERLDEEGEQRLEEATEEERRMAELEAREAELLAGQARLQAEAEAKADRIRALEAQCAALQHGKPERRSEEALDSQITEPSESEGQAIHEERRELQRLQEKAEEAAKALQQQQEALKHAAQERELLFLEEESEQMRLTSALREESVRLDQQRRRVSLLQQSLLEASPVKLDSARVEVQLDDTTCDAVHAADNEASGMSDPPPDGEDEVWDLDWNALAKEDGGAKPEGGAQEDASSSAAEGTETEGGKQEGGEGERQLQDQAKQ